jgi:DNA-binding transcriptional regulator PaaX
MSKNPSEHLRIIKGTQKEFEKINRTSLYRAIRKLYSSKLIDWEEMNDGIVKMTLSESGKERALEFNIDTIMIDMEKDWDGIWRIVLFDIPEYHKKGRDALSRKLKDMGCYPIQKSVFVSPHECKDEVDFISEVFGIGGYVRFMRTKDIDIDLHLRKIFGFKAKSSK